MLRVTKKESWLISNIVNYDDILGQKNDDPEFINSIVIKTSIIIRIFSLLKLFLSSLKNVVLNIKRDEKFYDTFIRLLSSYDINKPWVRTYKINEVLKLKENLSSISSVTIKGMEDKFFSLVTKDMKHHGKLYLFCNKI